MLESEGYLVNLQAWDVAPGDNFVRLINEWMSAATCVLALYSAAYFDSPWCESEWTAAFGRDVLVPIRLEPCTPPAILSPLDFVDIFGVDEEVARKRVIRAILRQQDREPGGFPGTSRAHVVGAAAPRKAWNVPPRPRYFSGRHEMISDVREMLISERAEPAAVALVGPPGIGKSQLAAEYCRRYSEDYDVVWWIPAADPIVAHDHFAELASRLGVFAGPDATATSRRVLAEFSLTDRWLLVYDNVLEEAWISSMLPGGGAGHILLTSRNPGVTSVARTIDVGVLKREEAVGLVQNWLPGRADRELEELAEALGYYPLGLVQASGTINETGMAIGDYVSLLGRQILRLLSVGAPMDYPVSIAAGWQLALEALKREAPGSYRILAAVSFMAPEPVQIEWLRRLEVDGEEGADIALLEFHQALGVIRRRGLARVHGNQIQMHRLPQLVTRNAMTEAERTSFRQRAEMIIGAANPGEPQHPTGWQELGLLLPHLLSLDPANSDNPRLRDLALDLAWYLHWKRESQSSLKIAREMGEALLDRFGENDQGLLSALHLEALAVLWLGDYDAAKSLYETVFARRQSVLGADHPDTLQSSNDLAFVYDCLGDYEAARALDEDTLIRRRAIFGEDHAVTLQSANGLAVDLYHLDRRDEGRELAFSVMERRTAVLGIDDVETLRSANSCAWMLCDARDFPTAGAMFAETLRRRTEVLGAENPETLRSRFGQAYLLCCQRRYAAALADAEFVVRVRSRLFGGDHVDTLRAKELLAHCMFCLNRFQESRLIDEEILRVRADRLEPESLDVLRSRLNLAADLMRTGDRGVAAKMNAELLEMCRSTLGEDDDITVAVGHNVGHEGRGRNARRLPPRVWVEA